ncbi:hypothetical protein AVDCRST_MAG92-5422 [uncultured Coleofasciculus sp.]|uniref:Uncharacterized protein n=1 Tax=uncultured Coleofasciculus sp. TaxID=1267456 RepID=A0A6J4KGC3_9CYAN|nr:hypothetical protein AVDCRST_MAG92-5422 [uncultured Coleofasciculus sp.]
MAEFQCKSLVAAYVGLVNMIGWVEGPKVSEAPLLGDQDQQ